jgi:prepilin-type N-terminal cleavage/methylation domain-containing protein
MLSLRLQRGVTLLEMMLVIVIGAMLLTFGFRQYLMYRDDADARLLMNNVNALMLATAKFYQANCYGQSSPSGGAIVNTGRLHPASNPPLYYSVSIPNRLIADGYLSSNLATVFPLNPIVNETGSNTYGYVVQLNSYRQNRLLCTAGTNAVLGANDPQCASTRQTGQSIIWKIQVSVLVRDETKINAYKNILGADCASSYSGNVVYPCAANRSGPYLVWERMPSSVATDGMQTQSSPGMNQMVNQFTQLYRNYPAQVTAGNPQGFAPPSNSVRRQYFVCGS